MCTPRINVERETPITIRQKKVSEQHRRTGPSGYQVQDRPMLGFKKVGCTPLLQNGIELMHLINR